MDAARTCGLSLATAEGFTSAPGVGVIATVDGRKVEVGAPARLLGDSLDAHSARAATVAAGMWPPVWRRTDGPPC
ncbi:hypothetical protein GCM10010339_79090 [Streptomyces alanosinicus]|uniref:Uncharacterized protein n=1 Tax=Streptomyces alanosinicus TaxID=68171 RepID=A0A918YRL6_9ACTN|nr:hypothetical protein GCM10010339_79090 [Streptomyces alanosinicus]